ALYTFGIFIEPAEHPSNDGFHRRNDPILDLVDKAPGFIARSGYEDEPGSRPWGRQVWPRFYEERGDGWSPATLSLWTDLESPMAFAYYGLHAEALSHGRQWFRKPEWPPYVLWWVDGQHKPDWTQAVERHEHLHDHGPSAYAFTFKQPFDTAGKAMVLDKVKVRAIAGTDPV
ncbi:MAG: DUF3291 domain-containing protein, partial [Aestuariivirgaceae bacterium]